jgi:hypothetical protein
VDDRAQVLLTFLYFLSPHDPIPPPMSLKHVLETARKLGTPVVITNENGDAAQVIMPFEDFAAMVGVMSPVGRGTPRVANATKTGDEEIAQALADLTVERLNEQAREVMEDIEREQEEKKAEQGQKYPDSLEDRFYLEPIEDGEGRM